MKSLRHKHVHQILFGIVFKDQHGNELSLLITCAKEMLNFFYLFFLIFIIMCKNMPGK